MYTFSNNLVKKATYRENVILIEFSEYMHIKAKENSYLNICNYLLKVGKRYFFIPKHSKIEIVEKGFVIRIILPKIYANKLFTINNIYLGYVCGNNFFYIQSLQGTIQNISTSIYLGKEIKILNIEDGIAKIIDKNTLEYIYKGENEFQNIYITDFFVKKLNKNYCPKYFNKKDNKIIFSFEEDIFYKFINDLSFNTVKIPKSKDIYGLPIKANSSLNVKHNEPTYVRSLSFCNYKNKIGYFKICFSASLSYFLDKDFLIEYKNILYKCFYESINNKKDTVDIKVYNLDIQDIFNAKFKLILLKNADNKIKTLDYKNEEVIIKEEIISNIFISENIDWVKVDNKLSGSIVKISFQNNVIPNSIITNSDFNENLKLWNGDNIRIPPRALSMENRNNLTIISLKNNNSFGEILIEPLEYLKFIEKTTYNENICFLSLDNNEIIIKFDENEKSEVQFWAIKSIRYNPGKNIQNLNGFFIFSGFSPIKHEELNNVIYIEPLKDGEKPFNGGVRNNSFVVKINNESKFRNYGNQNVLTTINGFLKVVGNLNPNESVVIENIKILGNIYLDIEESNINFYKIECNNLICE